MPSLDLAPVWPLMGFLYRSSMDLIYRGIAFSSTATCFVDESALEVLSVTHERNDEILRPALNMKD